MGIRKQLRFKLLSMFICVALLLNAAAVWSGFGTNLVSANSQYEINEDFDRMTMEELQEHYLFSPNPLNESNNVTIKQDPLRNGNAVYIEDQSMSAQTQFIRNLNEPLSGVVTVELDWYHEGSERASSIRPIKIFSSTNESAATTVAEIQTRDSGKNVALSVGSSHTSIINDYAINTWYRFKIVMNTDTKKVDVYVDGALKVDQGNFVSADANQIARIKSYTQDKPQISQYIDNLKVYAGTYSPDPDTGTDPDPGTNPETPPVTEPAEGDLIVAPDGLDSNAGTLDSPTTLTSAITRIQPGGTIFMRGGTYYYDKTVLIERNNSGIADDRKRIFAYSNEKPVLDFSAQTFDPMNRGLQIDGHYWHVMGIEVKEAGDNGIFIGGSYNRIENVETHHNKDTGLQISRYSSTATREEWPSYNEIINVYSHNNYDPDNGEDADGFAAKLTSGPGNIFDGCIAAYNVDDGWDLFTKTDTGPIDPVTIRNSIAYSNGATSEGISTSNSDGNGFKLGGSNIPVNHIVENNIAFNNKKHGFTFNSNPGSITMSNNTSWNNGMNSGSNFAFDRGTHVFTNNLSYKASASDKYPHVVDVSYSNLWWHNTKGSQNGQGLKVSEADFISLTPTISRNANGSPSIGNFLKLAESSSLKGAGTPAGTDIGVLYDFVPSPGNPDPDPNPNPNPNPNPDPGEGGTQRHEYDLNGFASGTTGGGELPVTDANYVQVYDAVQLGQALKRKSSIKVIEIMNDLELGWNEIPEAAKVAPFTSHAEPKTHPVLLETGVSKITVDGFDGLTIFSANGAKIKHAAFVFKRSANIIIRNLEFDELWEWDEQSKGDYDKNDWDYITLEESSNIWIDHSTFNKAYDGVIDAKKGTNGLTISWSLFRGDDGSPNSWVTQQINALEAERSQYPVYDFARGLGLTPEDIIAIAGGQKKGHLVGANELKTENNDHTVTLHHNYYKDMMDRMPRLRGGDVHAYNNIVMDSADAHAASKRLTEAMQSALASKGYKLGVTSNGAISTEGGAVLIEKSHIIDVLYPIRNNQKDAAKSNYTGKIKAIDTIYSLDGELFRGGSEEPDSPLSPVPAPALEFSWNNFSALPYSYKTDEPEKLIGRLLADEGAGAGKVNWPAARWLMTEGLGPELPQDQAPGQVTGLIASALAGQVNLSWNSVSGATAYHVKRSQVSGSGYTTIATINGTNYADSSVVNGTAYYYVITAMNTAGEGIASSEAQATPFIEEPSNPYYPPSGGIIQPEQQPEPQDTVWIEAPTTMSKGEDGQSLATVIVNEEALKKAFRTLKLSQVATPTIAVEIADEGSAVIVNLPLQALLAELAASSNAVLSVKTSEGEYSLSLDQLGLSSFTLQLDQSLEDAKLKIAIKPVYGNAATKIADSAASADAAILSGAIAYSVSIQASGSDIPLKNYVGYATRTINADLPVDLKHLAAVMYNPETGALTFAPVSFKIVDGKVTATLKRADNQIYMIISKKKTFNDLQGHWAKADVELLASKLIINGTAADNFAPSHSITRAEFASLLVRALGLKEEGAPQFRDVAQTAWYAGAIGAAVTSGIVNGYTDGTFAPNASITREEMAVMIARALSSTGAGGASSTILEKFDDSSQISGWARSAAAQAVDAGIIKGVTDQSFVPTAKATRADAAVMLKRLLQTVKFID